MLVEKIVFGRKNKFWSKKSLLAEKIRFGRKKSFLVEKILFGRKDHFRPKEYFLVEKKTVLRKKIIWLKYRFKVARFGWTFSTKKRPTLMRKLATLKANNLCVFKVALILGRGLQKIIEGYFEA